jgi:hypothetical protein
VYTTLQPTDARAIGLLGTCPEETGIPPEECVFSVEAVQYRRSVDGSIKFNVVCVDTEDTATGPNAEEEDIPPCSPVEREPLAFGVGPAFGVQVGGGGGIAAAVHAGAFAGVNVGIGFSAPIVIQRKLRYPLVRNYTGTAGGNILIESGVGSILAGETVVLAHGLTSFSGGVDFFITKPVGMTLSFGWERFRDDPVCADGSGNSIADCPQKLEDALQTACRFCGSGPGGSAVAQGAAVQSDFDIQELVDALDNETQAIDDIIEELKGRIEEKIPEAFETLQDFLGSGGGSAATAEQSVMVDKMMSLLRERITADLDEIRQIARDLVACPDN